jgi:chromosome segregation ATPase
VRGNSSLSIKEKDGISLRNENPYSNKQKDSAIESEETESKSVNSARGPGLRPQDDFKEQLASLKQKISDQEAKYTKEIEELKKQSQLKKAEFKENIQYTKKQMDQLKKQIEPLKQIIIQNREEKAQLKGVIKSLETVNEKVKGQIEDIRSRTRSESVTL